jgi:hypothetical protein
MSSYYASDGTNVMGSGGASAQSYVDFTSIDSNSSAAAGGISGEMFIHDPLNTTHHKWMRWIGCQQNNDVTVWRLIHGAVVLRDATTAISGFTLYFNSGNITSGNFKLYGIK